MRKYLSLVKFSHTVFALPFAMIGFFIATSQPQYTFGWKKLVLVLLCMVTVRNAAMAFNRFADRDIDLLNPRTKAREIPSGIISPKHAMLFVIANACLFLLATYFLNPLCFLLSPVVLLIVLGYSISKRFTFLCHMILGLGLSIAPVGAYVAVSGQIDIYPVLYGCAVLFWVAGFDIIYALQDEEFDRKKGLHSIPELLGKQNAVLLARVFHTLCAFFLVFASWYMDARFFSLDWWHWVGVVIFIALLIYQHTIVKPHDLSRINLAFFTTNGIASVVLGLAIIADLLI